MNRRTFLSLLFAASAAQLCGLPGSNSAADRPIFLPLISKPVANSDRPEDLQIRTVHPYLWVDDDLIKAIRRRTVALAEFHRYVRADAETYTDNPADVARIRQETDNRVARHLPWIFYDFQCYGIDAYINNDALSKEYCKQFVLSLLALNIPMSPGTDDIAPGYIVYGLGALYDWAYDYLDAGLKAQMRARIIYLLQVLDQPQWKAISSPLFSGGHSRMANVGALAGLLAIRNEVSKDPPAQQAAYFSFLGQVVKNWREGFNPTQAWISEGGGYDFGWAYTTSYTSMDPYLMWEYATNEESWFAHWQGHQVYWWLYGLRNMNTPAQNTPVDAAHLGGYANYPVSGDWVNTNILSTAPQLLGSSVAGNIAGDSSWCYAQWLYDQMYERHQATITWDILYRTWAPGQVTPPSALPLARHFPNSGFVLMRDSWDFAANTLLEFKSSSFYMANHAHKDENAFTIYYKTPLAIDSGFYSAYGVEAESNHWRNYYTRSVAHNTILVYDPQEDFGASNGVRHSRDGGQKFFDVWYPTLDQMRDGGVNHLDGIQAFENQDAYAYAAGNATKAYSAHKLQEFTRQIVYLRHHSYAHPAIVIYDRVIAKSAHYVKKYLLHTINEPICSGNSFSVEGDDGLSNSRGTLFHVTHLPLDAQLVKIGGRANGQEYYVEDNGYGQPFNYNEGGNYNNVPNDEKQRLREAGEWRIEIKPGSAQLDDRFLNVISIADDRATHAAVHSEYLSSAQLDGVVICNNQGDEKTAILFQRDNTPLDETIDTSKHAPFSSLFLAGLEKNARYTVLRFPSSLIVKKDVYGNLVSSDQGTIYQSGLLPAPATP